MTFYHQYQREEKADETTGEVYIETTLEDIAEANQLLKEILVRKSDELSGACRNYFEELKTYLQTEKKETFGSREIRSRFRLPGTTFRRYQNALLSCGYIRIKSGKAANGFQYEVASFEEYHNLRIGIENILDAILQNLQQATSPAVSQPENGSHKKQQINKKAVVSQ